MFGLALLTDGPDQFDDFRHFLADLFLDDLAQGAFREAQVGGVCHQRAADAAGAGIEHAHTARDEVDENIGVPNDLQGFFGQFRVHNFSIETSALK